MNNGFGRGWVLVAVAVLAGCVGRRDASDSSQSLVDSCSGDYSCGSPDDSFDIELTRQGAACDMGGILLFADGSIEFKDDLGLQADDFRWTGDVGSFDICADGGGCFSCENVDEEAGDDDGGGGGGECTGSPDSCSSQSPGSCSDVRGCYMHTVYGSDYLPSRYECRGSANSCSGFYSEESCERQGCDWE